MELDGFTITLLTACGTALTGTIGALWLKNGKLEDEKDQIRDKYQEKYEQMIKTVTELMVTSTNQTNTFTNSLNTITASVAALREEFLRGKSG